MPRPTLEDLQLENEAPQMVRDLQAILGRACVATNVGGGRNPSVSVQFRAWGDATTYHDILVRLMQHGKGV